MYTERIWDGGGFMANQLEELERELQDCKERISRIEDQIRSMRQENVASSPKGEDDFSPRIMRQLVQAETQPPKESSLVSAEAVIGKKVMGIVASVLIFISLIMFATLLIPRLGDTAKFVLMCLVSVAFAVFGLYKLSKDDKSALYLSITGCGVGAIYISLFLSNIYFRLTNDVGLFALLLLWAMGVLYLSKKRSKVFQAIGNAGIVLSVLFGTIVCVLGDDPGKMLILIVYFLVGSLAFYLCHMGDWSAVAVNHAFQLVSLFILMIGETMMQDEALRYVGIVLLAVFMLAMLALILIHMNGKNLVPSGTFGMLYSVELLALVMISVKNGNVMAGLVLALVTIILVSVEGLVHKCQRVFENHVVITLWTVLLAGIALLTLENVTLLAQTLGVALLGIPFACYGFLNNRKIYKILGLVSGYLLLFAEEIPIPLEAVWFVLILSIVGIGLYKRGEQYKEGYKVTWYLLTVCTIWMLLSRVNYEMLTGHYEVLRVVTFLLIASINVCMAKTRFGRNWITGQEEKVSYAISCVVNAILMFYGTYKIADVDSEVLHIIYILVSLALFTVNTQNLIARGKVYLDLYVVIKYTILLRVILGSFHAPNYLISILLFVLSIAVIFVGFKLPSKVFRIYGLVLSLFCVIKLVMIDITYDNTLGHALSFFVSGVLCFFISAIYYNMERRMRKEEQSE